MTQKKERAVRVKLVTREKRVEGRGRREYGIIQEDSWPWNVEVEKEEG